MTIPVVYVPYFMCYYAALKEWLRLLSRIAYQDEEVGSFRVFLPLKENVALLCLKPSTKKISLKN